MEASVQEVTKGFSRRAAEELSYRRHEPDWVREKRIEAWSAYETLPMPVRTDEEWRRTDIRRLPVNDVAPFAGLTGKIGSLTELPEAVAATLGDPELRSGINIQIDGATVYHELNADLAAQGVIFTDMETAIAEHPDLVKRYFMTDCVPATDNKFAALNGAFWSGGTFVYVPKGVQSEVPLRTHVHASTAGSAIFPHTLIVAEEDSSVVVVDSWSSPTSDEPIIAAGVIEIFAATATNVRYVQIQNWGRNVWNFTTQRTMVGQDAQSNSLTVGLGSRLSKSLIAGELVGAGASAEMLGLYFADERQHMDHQTRQMHVSPYATSDLLFKGAIKDRARTVYSGLIKVFPNAQRTDAYQANRNLVLSPTARADTIPNLEIGANDVRCTHGATVGQVEEEYIFYLMSRGINRTEAVKLIVDGFFDEVIERVPVPEVQEEVRAAIARKIGL
ncbi:MAG TPA: Fe-S cluster assembly protein SufD [Nitrolancea sp.]|jgi:Fe-S cluster assembly protein SufD|nr:Fe-S cluster assembly protein SufD [Nitrolancea sp.]